MPGPRIAALLSIGVVMSAATFGFVERRRVPRRDIARLFARFHYDGEAAALIWTKSDIDEDYVEENGRLEIYVAGVRIESSSPAQSVIRTDELTLGYNVSAAWVFSELTVRLDRADVAGVYEARLIPLSPFRDDPTTCRSVQSRLAVVEAELDCTREILSRYSVFRCLISFASPSVAEWTIRLRSGRICATNVTSPTAPGNIQKLCVRELYGTVFTLPRQEGKTVYLLAYVLSRETRRIDVRVFDGYRMVWWVSRVDVWAIGDSSYKTNKING